MATQMEQIQQILSALLQKIPDAQQQQQANDDQKLSTTEEMAKLSAEVKLLSEKFEEKCAMEKGNNKVMREIASTLKQLSRSSLESAPNESLMQKIEELKKNHCEHIGPQQDNTNMGSCYYKPELQFLYELELYHKKFAEAKKLT